MTLISARTLLYVSKSVLEDFFKVEHFHDLESITWPACLAMPPPAMAAAKLGLIRWC